MKNAWQRLKEAWANLPRSTKLLLAALLLVGGVALWYVGLYLGANNTQYASVTIDQPTIGRSLRFDDVDVEGRPFESAQY